LGIRRTVETSSDRTGDHCERITDALPGVFGDSGNDRELSYEQEWRTRSAYPWYASARVSAELLGCDYPQETETHTLALETIDKDSVHQVAAEDQELSQGHSLDEITRTSHFSHYFGEDHGATVCKDHVKDSVDLTAQLRTTRAKNRLPTDLGKHRDRIDAEYLDRPGV
jgi:hypothetical protein